MVSLLFYVLTIFHNKKLKRKYKDSVALSLFYFTVPIASVPWEPFIRAQVRETPPPASNRVVFFPLLTFLF